MVLMLVWLNRLNASQRNWKLPLSPRRIVLARERSDVMIPGRRRVFLPVLPMSPKVVGLTKHAILIMAPAGALFGSQIWRARALIEPPVKSVMAATPPTV